MPQRTKRTSENRDRIVKFLEGGYTRKAAYLSTGISHEAFAQWIKADESFAEAVETAEQKAIARNVLLIQQAAQPRPVRKTTTRKDKEGGTSTEVLEYTEEGDWRAAAWFLERREPESFGKRLDVTSNGETIKGYGASVDFDDL